jgi:protein-S-isoprenylcysteine O-methyltransferase Ste14
MADNEVQGKQEGARVRLPPPLVFLAAIVVGWLLPDVRVHGYHAIRIAIGLLLLFGGLALGVSSIRLFRRTGQDSKPWTPTPELILEGPYQHTRNPIYVSLLLISLAVSVLAGHGWIALLGFAALAVVHVTAVLPEERYLTAKFGESYVSYKTRVRRYL